MTPLRHRRALGTLVTIAVLAAILPLAAPSVRAGTATLFSEDFESGAIGPSWNRTDGNNASGLDYWGITGYRTHAGTYSAWAAQVGTQSDSGLNNSAVNRYDDDMRADLSIDLRADGFGSLTLSFWYYSRAESGGGAFIEAWYEAGGSPFQIFQNTGGTGNAWDSVSVAVPTTVERLIIRFVTDGANHNFEGAYVDDILLTGTEATPPTSSVSPLPTYANVVPYNVPYVAQDNPNASGVAYVELWHRQGTTGAYSLYNDTANPTGRWTAPPIPFDPPGGDGYYEFYTVAVDNAQNAEAPPLLADANLTFDTAAPSLAITAPSDGAWTGANVTVAWQGSDATSGIASFETSLDGGAFSPAGLAVSREFSGLAEGPHDVEVRATDSAGNSATSNVTFGVDTVAPSVSITAPSDGRLLHTSSVTLRWTGSDATSGIDRYEVWVDSGAPQAT
ncbi:MAG: Ig-like domain-containing protein, partial [Candidatus Thermoplasmatota archaeon]